MEKIDIVRRAFNFNTPIEEQKKYIADDFQFSDSLGETVWDKAAWFRMGDMYRAALPDAGFVIDEIHQEGEEVLATGHFTGTFKKDLDLTSMNMGVFKASGKKLNFPKSTSRISFKENRIYRNHDLSTGPNAGIAGFLAVFKES